MFLTKRTHKALGESVAAERIAEVELVIEENDSLDERTSSNASNNDMDILNDEISLYQTTQM